MLEKNKIYNMNCLEGMKLINDKSIDLILCDLPFGNTSNKWDKKIPFEPLWQEYERIIKDLGTIVLFATEPFSSELIQSNSKLFKYDWIWKKNRPNGHLEAKNKPLRQHEHILVFSKASYSNGCKNKMTYNPQGLKPINVIRKNSTQTKNYGDRKSRKYGQEFESKFTNYPRTILEFATDKEKLHPTQKPLQLCEYIIKTYTNERELILDNCIGSGTTAIAALNTNRNFIGFELDKHYCSVAVKRLGGKYV